MINIEKAANLVARPTISSTGATSSMLMVKNAAASGVNNGVLYSNLNKVTVDCQLPNLSRPDVKKISAIQ